MEPFTIAFDKEVSSYEVDINEEGVKVYGCDCAEVMPDSVVVKVYKKLGEYIDFKELDIE